MGATRARKIPYLLFIFLVTPFLHFSLLNLEVSNPDTHSGDAPRGSTHVPVLARVYHPGETKGGVAELGDIHVTQLSNHATLERDMEKYTMTKFDAH